MVTWYHWHTEPLLVGGLLLAGWCYAMLLGPLRERWFGRRPLSPHHVPCFALALIVFYLTVGSPLDALGEGFLFSAHMVQHNLLMYVVPPLMLLGLPSWLVDTAFSRWPWLRASCRFLVHPLVAGATFTLVFSLWHLPSLYEWALRQKTVHAVEHLSMFASSLLMWWGFLAPSRLLPAYHAGTQLLYLFALMVAQIPLFAVLTFAGEVLYVTYEWAPRVTALTPHEDQVLGGLIMKIANMVISLLLMGWIFYNWERQQNRRMTPEVVSGGNA